MELSQNHSIAMNFCKWLSYFVYFSMFEHMHIYIMDVNILNIVIAEL
jgi:hypothetical protein